MDKLDKNCFGKKEIENKGRLKQKIHQENRIQVGDAVPDILEEKVLNPKLFLIAMKNYCQKS
jgi:hypothetical protein